jgi:uncharacterized coiled-coil protein SlyX
MSRFISLRLALAALIAAAVLPLEVWAQSADPQSQTQSVADAARRAREQKKAAEKQPTPVITDDTLKRSAPAPDPSSDAAPAASAADASNPPNANAAAPSGQPAPGSPSENADQKAKASAEVTDLKKQLAEAQKGMDLVQRELSLEQDNVYSKPDYTSNTAGLAKLEDLKQQLTDKQQAVDALKAHLAELLDSIGAAPEPPAAPTAPPAKPPQP